MMLAETNEIEAEFVGQHGFVDDVADHLRMRKHCAASALGDIAKSIQSECERCSHRSGLWGSCSGLNRSSRCHKRTLGNVRFPFVDLPPHPPHPRADIDLRT